jgi:hypothetical protein
VHNELYLFQYSDKECSRALLAFLDHLALDVGNHGIHALPFGSGVDPSEAQKLASS